MTYLKTLARVAGIAVCVVAFCGTALADPGNGNGGPAATPPGQVQKAETPAAAAPTPAPQAAAGQENKAENQAEHVAAKAEPKAKKAEQHSAKSDQARADHATKAAKPAKVAGDPAKAPTTSKGQSANAHHHVVICHRTGSLSNPYVVINIPYTAWAHAHSDTTGSHPDLNGNHDKLLKDPASRPGSKDGFTKAACGGAAVTPSTTQVTPSAQASVTSGCPATTTTTEQVLVGIKHYTGSRSNPYVVIGPSEKSAHLNGKHADDQAMYETRTVTRTFSGENCASVTQVTVTPTGQQPTAQPTVQPTAQPVGEVAGAVSPANAKAIARAGAKAAPKSKPAGGVLGAVASAPKAVAQTATSDTLPFTGIPLWIAALIGGSLLATGLVLRRSTS